MRKEIYALYDNVKKGKETRQIYKQKLRRYKYKCLKAQNQDKRRIMEIIQNEIEMAKYIKQTNNSNSPKVTSFRTNIGQTDPGKETADYLLKAHYPSITEKSNKV